MKLHVFNHSVEGEVWESSFRTSSQVILMRLVHRPVWVARTGVSHYVLLFTYAGGGFMGRNFMWPGLQVPLKSVCFNFCQERCSGTVMCPCWLFWLTIFQDHPRRRKVEAKSALLLWALRGEFRSLPFPLIYSQKKQARFCIVFLCWWAAFLL